MFWVIDNFLMRKNRKLWSLSNSAGSSSVNSSVQFINNKKKEYVGGVSDDEVQMHLMAGESHDTLIEERFGSSSETESLFRRNGSESGSHK